MNVDMVTERGRERKRKSKKENGNVPGNQATTGLVPLLMPTSAGHQITHTTPKYKLIFFLLFSFVLVDSLLFLSTTTLRFFPLLITRTDKLSRLSFPHRIKIPLPGFLVPMAVINEGWHCSVAVDQLLGFGINCRENVRERNGVQCGEAQLERMRRCDGGVVKESRGCAI